MDPFELETFAHQLVEIGIRPLLVDAKIAEQNGTPTLSELDETAQCTVRETVKILNDPKFHIVPPNTLPWP
jgi:hypothetical protein